MAKNNGIYFLVKKNVWDGSLEYFNFEEMAFADTKGKGVQLSTIDALTTSFFDGNDLCSYLERKDQSGKETWYKYYISYKATRKSDEEKKLNPVWGDRVLNAISKITDGQVDFSHNNVYDTFIEIFSELQDQKSGLARNIINSKKDSTRLSDHNKDVVGVIASSSDTNTKPTELDVMHAFSQYKDFRALYLGFRDYHRQPNTFKELLSKIKF